MQKGIILFAVLAASGVPAVAEEIQLPSNHVMEMEEATEDDRIGARPADEIYAEQGFSMDYDPSLGRVTFSVLKSQRGTSLAISERVVADLCGDGDGCELRLGMYNWDNTGRTASRSSIFYYNNFNRAYRASLSDAAGTNGNGPTEHPMSAWACYFTDGKYQAWTNLGDTDSNFGLLSWKQYVAACQLTIID